MEQAGRMTRKAWRTKAVTDNDSENMDDGARTMNSSASMEEDNSNEFQLLVTLL